ncbi:MAG: hypothetical protein QNJ47_02160 [Nostocaceae cyanobacterium]|nr:hypothetical protein [Nostocaceae cyanobacterium]
MSSYVALGTTFAGLTFASQSALAINITQSISYNQEITQEQRIAPDGWTDLGWKVEGRAGAAGGADWEFGVRPSNDSQPVEQLEWDWINGQEVRWNLTWDKSNQKVSFQLDNKNPIDYTLSNIDSLFNGFYLWTRATTVQGKVDPGTNVYIEVNNVNGENVNPLFSTTTATNQEGFTSLRETYFLSDREIDTLSGILKMSWEDGAVNPQKANARSRLGLKVKGFSVASIPEPGSIFGLLVIGALGIGSVVNRNQDS